MARSRPSRNTAARRLAAGAAFLLLALGGVPAHAQDKVGAAEPPARAETRHTITLAGRPLDYRAIAETIGKGLGIPVRSLTPAEAQPHFAWLAHFVAVDNPTSSALTRERLDWQPAQQNLLTDLREGGYFF